MKKTNILVAAATLAMAALSFTSCGSTAPSTLATAKTADKTGTVEILEHKGSAWGAQIPAWVGDVMSTPNQETLRQKLGLQNMHIWVMVKNGPHLEYLQQWVDQVDGRAEIATSFKQVIADTVSAKLKGKQGLDANAALSTEVQTSVDRVSERVAANAVAGISKQTDWWTRNRMVYPNGTADAEKYSYLVVYAMDEALFNTQLQKALEQVQELDVSEMLQSGEALKMLGETPSVVNTPDAE